MIVLWSFTLILAVSGIDDEFFECGVVKEQREAASNKGIKDSYPGQWPWLGALFKVLNLTEPFSSTNRKFFCGTVIINSKTLITGKFVR